jgi:tetratricopeptide (TPR) repeat protein
MKNYLQILCFLCAAALIIGAFCVSSHKRAEQAYQDGAMDLQSDLPTNALADFSRAIQLDPKSAPAYIGRAGARLGLKDFTNAIADCSTAIELDPTNERALFIRGTARLQLQDFDGTISDLSKALSLSSDDEQAHFYRAVAQIHTRDWDSSKADFTKAIQLNPYNAKSYQGRALVEMKLKEYENTIMDASNAIQLDTTTAAASYCLEAHAKASLKDRTGSFADVDQAIKLKPGDPSGYAMRATCDILWDGFSSASNDIQTISQLSSTNSKVFLCRAMLEQKCRQTDAAIADYRHFLAGDPNNTEAPELHEALGHLEEDLFQWPQALKEFQAGVAAKSPPDQMRFELFLTERRLGQTLQAQDELNAYIQSIPSSKTNEWTTNIAHFLAGDLNETDFLAQATTTAKRPTDIPERICDAYYYEGMQHLLANDNAGALARFQKSVDTQQDNSFEYMSAQDELKILKNP